MAQKGKKLGPTTKSGKLASVARPRNGNNSLHPLTPDDAMRAVLNISPADVKRINGSRPGGGK